MSTRRIAGLAILMICQISLAGPPDKALIPDSASWVAHLDVEALMATKTFKALAGIMDFFSDMEMSSSDEGDNKKNIPTIPVDVRNMLKDIKSATFYGLPGSESQPVAIVRGKLDKPAIMKLLGFADDKPAEMYGTHKIFRSGDKTSPLFHLCFSDDSMIFACSSIASLRSQIDLADGSGKALARDNALSEMLTADKGTVAIVAAKDIDGYARLVRKESPEAAAILAKIKNTCLHIGEKSESIFVSAMVSATTDEHAANIEQVLKGLVAMGKLASDGDKGLAMIMKILKPTISRDGVRVDVEVKASLEEIMVALMTAQLEMGLSGDKESPATSASRPAPGHGSFGLKFRSASAPVSRPAVKAEK